MNPAKVEPPATPGEIAQRQENLFFSQMWKSGGQAATSFLQAPGVSSLIGMGLALGRKQERDSSDDDTSQAEDEAFIAYGARGIIVFNCMLVREGTSVDVTVHLDLYNGIVRIFNGSRRQKYKCVDLVNMIRGSECTIQMESRKSLASGPKIFRFAGRELAYQFQQYVEYIQDCGGVLRHAFNEIDQRDSGEITAVALGAALSSLDIDYNEEDINKMLQLSAQKRFDFSDFFHVLLGTPVYSLFSCLSEWFQKAHRAVEIVIPPEDCDDLQQVSAVASADVNGAASPDSKQGGGAGAAPDPVSARRNRPAEEVISFADIADATPSSAADMVQRLAQPRTVMAPGERDVTEESMACLAGESVANIIPRVKWYIGAAGFGSSGLRGNQDVPSAHPFVFGSMAITNYRIALSSSRKHPTNSCKYHVPPFFDTMTIPLNSVHKLSLLTSSLSQQKCSIRVHTKDLRVVRIHFMKPGHGLQYVEMLLHMLQRLCFSGVRAHLFAYRYLGSFNHCDGWSLSDVRFDYVRMGLDHNPDWQILDNTDFSLVETYPPYLVLPAALSDNNIQLAADFRSKSRLPVVTYFDEVSGCVLLRSAQPLVGITLQTSSADQLLLNHCRLSGTINSDRRQEVEPTFYILDARGQIAATVNMAAGKGTEDVSTYTCTELEFCNIENIHVMRSSYNALGDMLCPPVLGSTAQASSGGDSNFYIRLDDSGWTKHCRLLLIAAVKAAERLRLHRCSVLVHCSDGWDRTAQICALTQVMLDPFYRTIKGFAVLIEKEWCSFGYKFQDRCGHAEASSHLPDERSPVFVQWLDALYQLISQFPSAFQFTDVLLVFVADHVHSGLFGNFLGNCEKQRVEGLKVRETTKSIWSYVMHNEAQFTNSAYAYYPKPLWPRLMLRDMQLWERFYCRWDVNAHPHHVNGVEWHDDWGNGYETRSNN